MSAYFDSLNRRARTAQIAPAPAGTPRPARPSVAPARRLGVGTLAADFAAMRERILVRAQGKQIHSLVVAGCTGGEGSARVARGFAETLAASGLNVLLVDADPRATDPGEPAITPVDLADLLGGRVLPVGEACGKGRLAAIRVLMANADKEQLRSPEFGTWLQTQRATFGYVILALPPILQSSEATLAGLLADGTVVVVEAEVTPRAAVLRVKEQLEKAGANLIGAVLNGAADPVPARLRPYLGFLLGSV